VPRVCLRNSFEQAGKRKVKNLARIYQKLNRSPFLRRHRQASSDVFGSPHRPGVLTSTSVKQFLLDIPKDIRNSWATNPAATPSYTPGEPRLEQRPLRSPGSRFTGAPGTYGSIVVDSPLHVPSDLASLRLPDPAIDSRRVTVAMDDQEGDEYPPDTTRSNTVRWSQIDPVPAAGRSKSFSSFPNRANPFTRMRSPPPGGNVSQKTPLFRRVFPSGDFGSPGKSFQGSVYSDIERYQDEFFNFLDSELEKIDSFYRQKESEATDRLQELRQQLHVMRDQRTQEVIAAQRYERSNRSSDDNEGGGDGLLSGIFHESRWKQIITGKSRFGKNSRALAVMATTPHAPLPRDLDEIAAQRRDFVRLPLSQHVPYRTAKRKLKQALQEFYRGLELLKSYAYLNRKAFRKLNKKYDKAVNARPMLCYMSYKVNKTYFVQSDVIEGHLATVEDLYARYFGRGNHKLAVSKLRGDLRSGDYSPNTFRDGAMIAAGVVSCAQGLILAENLLYSPDAIVKAQTSYLLQVRYHLSAEIAWPQKSNNIFRSMEAIF
jgi:xenotropic and polytropic retrovirus receptor 1